MSTTLQVIQAQMISAGGFAVKNTFIDVLPTCGTGSSQKRARTAPPGISCRNCGRQRSSSSISSTSCPESEIQECSSEATPNCCWERDDTEGLDSTSPTPLQSLIELNCRFLLLQEFVLHPLRTENRQKSLPEGVTKCLRIFIRGLPVAKRSKWQHPLSWTALQILQRVGCEAFVKRGQLFAPLDGASGSEVVRVDFSPSRA